MVRCIGMVLAQYLFCQSFSAEVSVRHSSAAALLGFACLVQLAALCWASRAITGGSASKTGVGAYWRVFPKSISCRWRLGSILQRVRLLTMKHSMQRANNALKPTRFRYSPAVGGKERHKAASRQPKDFLDYQPLLYRPIRISARRTAPARFTWL